jgi:hypothetical protein
MLYDTKLLQILMTKYKYIQIDWDFLIYSGNSI